MSKFLDSDGLLYLWGKVKTLVGGKVDKVDGKGLSTNDYTTDEKNKLASLSNYDDTALKGRVTTLEGAKHSHTNKSVLDQVTEGTLADIETAFNHTTQAHAPVNAEANVLTSIKVNGTTQTITNKAVDITVPTNNNQLANGAGYQTASQVQSIVNTAISAIQGLGLEKEIVDSLPAASTADTDVIYLVANNGGNGNGYDEYIVINGSWEQIGTTSTDLSGYLQEGDIQALTNAEIDAVTE